MAIYRVELIEGSRSNITGTGGDWRDEDTNPVTATSDIINSINAGDGDTPVEQSGSDGTWAQNLIESAYVIAWVGSLSIPAGALIKAVRFAWRAKWDVDPGRTSVLSSPALTFETYYGDVGFSQSNVKAGVGSYAAGYTSWATQSPDGDPWGQDSEDFGISGFANRWYLRFRAVDNSNNALLTISRAYIEVLVNEKPTVSITAPTSNATVTDNAEVFVESDYSDPDNDPIQAGRWVVESGDHTADSSPDLVNNEYDSGKHYTSSSNHTTDPLSDGVKTIWVKLWQTDVGSRELSTDWDNVLVTMDVGQPNVPTLTVLPSETPAPHATLNVSDNSSVETPVKYQIQYSDDGGETWEFVRDCVSVPTTAGTNLPSEQRIDYEVPADSQRLYRARSVSSEADGGSASEWTASKAVNIGSVKVWLRDPYDPNRDHSDPNSITSISDIVLPDFSTSRTRDRGVFHGIGSSNAVVAHDVPRGRSGTLPMEVVEHADYDTIVAMWESGRPLLLDDDRDSYWIIPADLDEGRQFQTHRRPSFEFIEVFRPPVEVLE